MLLSSKAVAVRAVIRKSQRAFSVPPKTTIAIKTAQPTLNVKPPNTNKPPNSSVDTAITNSSTGSSLSKVLLLGLLSTPAATAVYIKQNPEWNPATLKDDVRWIKFRELVLGNEATDTTLAPMKRTPEDFSSAINNAHNEMKAENEEKVESKADKLDKKLEKAAKKAVKAEKKVAKLKNELEFKKVESEVHKDEGFVEKRDTKAAAVDAGAASALDKKQDDAMAKARDEIAKLAGEASPDQLFHQLDNQIQATTNGLLSALKEESEAAAAEMDKHYMSGLDELDAKSLAIRVAQLATEMKHRSKWEAVRLLESLRHMEENVQKKSTEMLRRQSELHKELLARELRLQRELLSRQMREEIDALKKQYSDDLARSVSQQRMSLLSELQRTFDRERKAIQERYNQQLEEATQNMQKSFTDERAKRVQELKEYRAELCALGEALDSSSTYEAFSHRVHKASMAALALSDRVEAAAPLRSGIRALREAARNDPFIDAAIKSLPQEAIEQGAPSVGQLQERFKVVKSVGHRTALVPENSGLIGQAFGTALSLLMIPPGGPIEGTDTDAVLSRAEFALKSGDIEKAVEEMKALSGLPAQVSHDWISAAQSRLAVEQTAKVIKAHVALLAASCS
ncbi:mitochondrion protein [Plasmopara halstedii]|uniref:Mitochondrion protein n=1 Tax=Plasmopara halstedii TaxID=4781 RepID=A0A0P1AJJ8_PLAHL|nr:mitochondrion protein [Plasmopara halstedii]CEG41248.1 mitochondrion protein [Plasmopara halstedii]|eukprot:XP_024577617.1 mitochondrion protein [Plasmopara halstedii]